VGLPTTSCEERIGIDAVVAFDSFSNSFNSLERIRRCSLVCNSNRLVLILFLTNLVQEIE
jgi:hypothetical protein